jgi:2,4-dienoyl-CoA reductase-like NADH-dependent reductase (Old Yellow Enzyme family)
LPSAKALPKSAWAPRYSEHVLPTLPFDASNKFEYQEFGEPVKLFQSFRLRQLEFKNRIAVSSMCEYSAIDGHPTTWHMVHLGSRAVGGAALVMAEASAVTAIGRISLGDTGLYLDSHVTAWQPIVRFINEQGAMAGIQLAHAGRKASTDVPWRGGKPLTPEQGAWTPIAPSPLPFDTGHAVPKELTIAELDQVVVDFVQAAYRAQAAGFQVAEIHAAHGYLLHQFLSPLSNQRADSYGGSFQNRIRLLIRVTQAVREAWPKSFPLFVRISATDWTEGGWNLEQSIELSQRFKDLGVDLVDVSSGGAVPHAKIPVGPGYQVEFSDAIRKKAAIATGAVGMITEPAQAATILSTDQADMVFLARELLRDPYWPRHAAKTLGVELTPPPQYARAW